MRAAWFDKHVSALLRLPQSRTSGQFITREDIHANSPRSSRPRHRPRPRAGPGHHQVFRHPADRAPSSYAEKYFGEEVATLTKGTVKVEVYHNTQLGDAVANVQSVRNGTIGFTTVSASNLNQVVPAMDMYSLPFLFKNEAHFWWFLAQPEAAALAKQMEDKGIKIIGYIDSGSRNFFTQKAVRTPDDLKGQKIRVMASPVMVNTMKALGATGVPVAWAELYALQTGVVDGAENNHPSVVAKKFYEVSKYYSLDEHMRIPDVIAMSTKLWNQLSGVAMPPMACAPRS